MSRVRIKNSPWPQLRRVRQVVQFLAFTLYIYLLFTKLPWADLFFRLDPLVAAGAMLAARSWIPRLGLALVTIGLTIVLGRVWCGWLCPLGTLLDWLPLRSAKKRPVPLSPRWRIVKNVLLIIILSMALFGSLSLLIFDPITILTRTMAIAILPALNYAVTATERAAYDISVLQPVVNWIESNFRGTLLPEEQPVFSQNVFIAVLFFGILGLNLVAHRFWCRYLCPLGALLGLLSKISLLRPVIRTSQCSRCNRCASTCLVDAIETDKAGNDYHIIPAECTVCLDCFTVCAKNGIEFNKGWQPDSLRQTDPSRRQVLTGLASGAVGVAMLNSGITSTHPDSRLIRPPGVEDEAGFLSRCLRCSQCMQVCRTSGLQPALLSAGVAGLWTPQLISRLGHCDFGCNACGQVCPSGAIPLLDLAQKREAIMGVAVINRNRCLPWAYDTPCIVCEEMCPISDKAIKVEEVTVTGEQGESVTLQRPYVLDELCIGCGTCENQCPVEGEAAINIYRA